jgi:ABC-type cobalamin/Fe3+-siderophores transport system ATPase subunit
MKISIIERLSNATKLARSELFLTWNEWNDYNFKTMFGVFYFDKHSIKHDLDWVRIGYYGQNEHERQININDVFLDKIPHKFFSLGSTAYYEKLNELEATIRDNILYALNDIAKDPSIFKTAIEERVTKISLLRGRSETEVIGQLRRMANGGKTLTSYDFKYHSPTLFGGSRKYDLEFFVDPESIVPTNIHVLIGRNASGKTTVFNNMIKSLLYENAVDLDHGTFEADVILDEDNIFANLISISFSAFDEAGLERATTEKPFRIPYTYIGLKRFLDENSETITLKGPVELTKEFIQSLVACFQDLKKELWQDAMEIIKSDPNLKSESIDTLTETVESLQEIVDAEIREQIIKNIEGQFRRLSSGHKIILLTITRLVETLEEKSLVLVDEPETHLHPPLLSSFIRAVSELLNRRNGVSIIATHSPVVLQEVPSSCVWKLQRLGLEAIAERLEIDSFGENVGILTREVFGLEVTASGFYSLLDKVTNTKTDYESILNIFNDQLGMEARYIVRTLIANKTKEG